MQELAILPTPSLFLTDPSTSNDILSYLGLWSLIGAIAFSIIVIFLFRSGTVYNSRTEEGHLKKEMPLRGILSMLIFLILVVAFIALSNYISLISRGFEITFLSVFLLNLALILILVVYDTLVIDWWVIGFWRPRFLNLPETMNKEQMKVHIKRTFVVAPIISLVIALLSAGVTVLIW
jgi:hypothetical protein